MLAKAHSTMLVLPLTNTQVSTSCAHAMYGGYRTMTAVCTYMSSKETVKWSNES